MRTGLTNRIVRLETARGRADGLLFVAWGRDQAEIEQALADARESGAVRDGDTVVRAAWPNQTPLPLSRWVPNQRWAPDSLSESEFDALADMARELVADARSGQAPAPGAFAVQPRSADYIANLSDVQLFAYLHGHPLEATAP
jgi:hypothetical protein